MDSEKESMINSHIQMPKLLLKRFHNKHNHFYYYDIEKQFIGEKGTAKSINTEYGYYSIDMEHYLRDNIEAPFGEVISFLEKDSFKSETLCVPSDFQITIKNFLYALIARGPKFENQMNEAEELLQYLTPQEQHDVVAYKGINIAKKYDLLSDFIVTFMINETDIPFVLSMDGLYGYSFNNYLVINLPISPKSTVSLFHKSYSNRIEQKDGSLSMFQINKEEDIMIMNQSSFLAQIRRNWGYVVCPEKKELERLKRMYE
ncbi:MAG: DUF4238 domain-containing protein [Ruminococcaceae bacterium]|nr:DUF4238 domain-containing protein [Oscillospiraceae bacterium]